VALNPIFEMLEAIKAKAIAASGGASGAPADVPTPPMRPNIPTPGEAPPEAAPPPAIPEAYKSPPDLVQMYTKLMQKAQAAESIRRGGTMIAAGITPYQDNREALLRLAGSGGGSGDGSGGLSMASILAMQKQQMEEAERGVQRAALPALMQKWNIDSATISYLDSTGQLDEVLAELSKPHTQVVETPRSGRILVDTRTGETIKMLSASEPRETTYRVEADGSRTLVDKATNEVIAGAEKLGPDPATAKTIAETATIPAEERRKDIQVGLDTTKTGVAASAEKRALDEDKKKAEDEKTLQIYAPLLQKHYGLDEATVQTLIATGKLGEVVADLAKPKNEVVKSENDHSVRIVDMKSGGTVRVIDKGASPDDATEFHKFDDGHEELIYTKSKRRVSDGTQITETPAKDLLGKEHQLLEEINAGRKARHQTPLTVDQAVKIGIIGGSGVTVNVGGGKIQEGWEPVLDENGDVVRNPDGTVKTRKIGGEEGQTGLDVTEQKADIKKTEAGTAETLQDVIDKKAKLASDADAAAKAKMTTDEAEVAGRTKYRALDSEIDDAIENLKEHDGSWVGTTGWGAALNWWPGRNPSRTLSDNLGAITSSIAIDAVTEMRKASPNGGALGNVTDSDVGMLKRVFGTMDQWGDDRELAKRLRRLKVARHLVVDGIHDPKVPKTDKNPNQVRVPTESEIDAAIQAAEEGDEAEDQVYKGLKIKRSKKAPE
jgi:hypothetical protein